MRKLIFKSPIVSVMGQPTMSDETNAPHPPPARRPRGVQANMGLTRSTEMPGHRVWRLYRNALRVMANCSGAPERMLERLGH